MDEEESEHDSNGHGTMCASIIGARGSDDVIGVVPGARCDGDRSRQGRGGDPACPHEAEGLEA